MRLQDDYLDAGMRGWIVTTARKNYRRIAGYEVEDLVQDGYMCFFKCRMRYVGATGKCNRLGEPYGYLPYTQPDQNARRHFQALVKTAFNNHITTLACKQPNNVELAVSQLDLRHKSNLGHRKIGEPLPINDVWDRILPDDPEVASAAWLLRTAPDVVKQLFQLLVNDALEFGGYLRLGKGRRAPRETSNQRFCRLLGLPNGYDIVGQVEKHFLK